MLDLNSKDKKYMLNKKDLNDIADKKLTLWLEACLKNKVGSYEAKEIMLAAIHRRFGGLAVSQRKYKTSPPRQKPKRKIIHNIFDVQSSVFKDNAEGSKIDCNNSNKLFDVMGMFIDSEYFIIGSCQRSFSNDIVNLFIDKFDVENVSKYAIAKVITKVLYERGIDRRKAVRVKCKTSSGFYGIGIK
jgi:hypothetical protein